MKTKKRGRKFISCLASNFEQPIAVLVERLLTVPLPESPDDKPREPEVDYATTLVVLLIFEFEAWVSRARHFDGRAHITKDKKEQVLSWLKSLNDPSLKQVIDRLT